MKVNNDFKFNGADNFYSYCCYYGRSIGNSHQGFSPIEFHSNSFSNLVFSLDCFKSLRAYFLDLFLFYFCLNFITILFS